MTVGSRGIPAICCVSSGWDTTTTKRKKDFLAKLRVSLKRTNRLTTRRPNQPTTAASLSSPGWERTAEPDARQEVGLCVGKFCFTCSQCLWLLMFRLQLKLPLPNKFK